MMSGFNAFKTEAKLGVNCRKIFDHALKFEYWSINFKSIGFSLMSI